MQVAVLSSLRGTRVLGKRTILDVWESASILQASLRTCGRMRAVIFNVGDVRWMKKYMFPMFNTSILVRN